MSTVVARAPQTAAVRTFLAAAAEVPVGHGVKPDGAGWVGAPGQSAFVGYGVLHALAGGRFDGSTEDPHAESMLLWQVNSYGATQLHAEEVADAFRVALLQHPLPPIVVAGRTLVWITSEVPAGTAREDPDQPSIWWCFERFEIATVPTT